MLPWTAMIYDALLTDTSDPNLNSISMLGVTFDLIQFLRDLGYELSYHTVIKPSVPPAANTYICGS
jgi:hypothetical protein